MSKGKIFRDALKRGMVTAPGCYDCIGARAIERAGFEAAYMTGAGTAAMLGYPDYGLVTMSEMAVLRPGVTLLAGDEVGVARQVALMDPGDVVVAVDLRRCRFAECNGEGRRVLVTIQAREQPAAGWPRTMKARSRSVTSTSSRPPPGRSGSRDR